MQFPLSSAAGAGVTMAATVLIERTGFKVTTKGLEIFGGVAFETWEMIGQWLGQMAKGIQWALGDWLHYGESQEAWGETYSQGIDATGLDYQTLANYRWVSSRFEIDRRREKLSWTHHMVVAAMEPRLADEWLDQAERESMSTQALKDAIAAQEGRPADVGAGAPADARTPLRRAQDAFLALLHDDRTEFMNWVNQGAVAV